MQPQSMQFQIIQKKEMLSAIADCHIKFLKSLNEKSKTFQIECVVKVKSEKQMTLKKKLHRQIKG